MTRTLPLFRALLLVGACVFAGGTPGAAEEEPDAGTFANPREVEVLVHDAQGQALADREIRVEEFAPLPLIAGTAPLPDRLAGFDAPALEPGRHLRTRTFRTDEDGRLRVAVPFGSVTRIVAPGDARHIGAGTRLARESDRRTLVRLVLVPGRTASGVLQLPDGTPVAGYVRYTAIPTRADLASIAGGRPPGRSPWIATDAKGRFPFVVPPHAVLNVDAAVPARYRIDGQLVSPGLDAPTPLRLGAPVRAGRTLSGTLRDAEGRRVAGVQVAAEVEIHPGRPGPRRQLVHGVTDAEGRYRLTGFFRGHLRALRQASATHVAPSFEGMDVPVEHATAHQLDVRLEPRCTVRGRVTDPTGRPISGAVVRLLPQTDMPSVAGRARWTVTDGQGRYTIRDALPGIAEVQAWYPGSAGQALFRIGRVSFIARGRFASDGVFVGPAAGPADQPEPPNRRVHVRPGAPTEVSDLRLEAGRPVTGWLLHPDGTPRPYGEVTGSIVRTTRTMAPAGPFRIRADAAGRFVFPHVPIGCRLRVSPVVRRVAGIRRFGGGLFVLVDVHPDADPAPIRIVVSRDAIVRGIVRRADGSPVPHAAVYNSVSRAPVFTDLLGRWEQRGIPRGKLSFFVRETGVRRAVFLDVKGPGTLQLDDLVVQGKGRVRGHIDFANAPRPVGVTLQVKHAPNSLLPLLASGPDGHFRISRIPRQSVSLSAAGGTFHGHVKGDETQEARITPDGVRPARVTGLVRGPDGAPIPFGSIRFRAGSQGTGTVPIVAGHVSVSRRKLWKRNPVEFVVQRASDAYGRALNVAPRIVQVDRADLARPIEVDLEPGGIVTGTVRDDDGDPAGEVFVALKEAHAKWWLIGRQYQTRAAADGSFRIVGLPTDPAPWNLHVTTGPRYGGDEFVRVTPGASEVQLQAFRLRSIAGTVVDVTGTPQVGAVLRVRRLQRGGQGQRFGRQVATDARGAFRVDRIHPKHEIEILVYGPNTRSGELTSFLPADRTGTDLWAAPQRIVLRRPVAIEGRIEGLPKGAWTTLELPLLSLDGESQDVLLHADGRFEATGVPEGTYAVDLALKAMNGRLAGQLARLEGPATYTTGTGPLRLRFVVK